MMSTHSRVTCDLCFHHFRVWIAREERLGTRVERLQRLVSVYAYVHGGDGHASIGYQIFRASIFSRVSTFPVSTIKNLFMPIISTPLIYVFSHRDGKLDETAQGCG